MLLMSREQVVLSADDRDFFLWVKGAILANPFSEERTELNKKILGRIRGKVEVGEMKQLVAKVAERLVVNVSRESACLKDYPEDDQSLLRYGILFHAFHLFCDQFDQLIEEQIAAGSESCKVGFAQQAISLMTKQGIVRKDAVQSFSFFYQMRRAFFFINKIVGCSSSMKSLRRSLWNNIFTHDIELYERYLWDRLEDFSTMLLGETGTGKTIAAAAIGRSGHIPFDVKNNCFAESFTRAFVALNLSQFPEQLLESELFGHKKGAFTGAVGSHDGVFSRCSKHGAIFLDEIGEVSIPVQIKLLQVLQERFFSPVGSYSQKRFSGRVIAATNRSMDKLRASGVFRDDFHYRLCSDVIMVPPLRQRLLESPGELDELLQVTMERIVGRPSPELVSLVKNAIKQQLPGDYPWPGNVRELEQCCRRILLNCQYKGDDLAKGGGDSVSEFSMALACGEMTATELLSRYCKLMYRKYRTYEAVAKRTNLDRRTVKKYIQQ